MGGVEVRPCSACPARYIRPVHAAGGLAVVVPPLPSQSTDGVLEAIEISDAQFRLGVEWHPEVGWDSRLFEALASAARHRKGDHVGF